MTMSRRMKTVLREPTWSAARTAARPTARWRVLPDFLIVGGQRCGTTSLHDVISPHPNVASPRLMKGVHYFDTSYGRGESWYRSNFHTEWYRSLREHRSHGPYLAGEASPYYLFHPLAAERIHATVPQARIIMLLRNPADRAISHHRHEQRRFGEELNLVDALAAEPDRLAGQEQQLLDGGADARSYAHQHYSYVARGRYAGLVQRYLDRFDREQILVLQSETFFTDPESVYDRILDFLDLPSWRPDTFPRSNATKESDVDPAVRAALIEDFAEDNNRLYELIGEEFDWQ